MALVAEAELAATARSLVERLGGHWTGRGGMCRCPAHDDRRPSLSIRVGDYGLLYHCFAGCDATDVLRAVRGLDDRALNTTDRTIASPRQTQPYNADRLYSLWGEAIGIAGSPAERYLEGRGLAPPLQGLRFHRRVPLGAGRETRFRPAVLAAIQEGSTLVALHRTFLAADGSCLAPDLDRPRRMLGRPGRGAIRLARASPILGIAEGIETALSATLLLGIPVWAALGNERLPQLDLPLGVRRLLILADDDPAGRRSAAAAAKAHAAPGRSVIRLWPGRGHNDWNDRVLAGGKGVGSRVRQAA
jgi:hypothetical protein